jgi:hypothetical protein
MRFLLAFPSPESGAARNSAARTLGDLWCRLMHTSIMWPVHGYYACATCGRLYPVPWANIHGAVLAGTASGTAKEIRPVALPPIGFEAETSMRFSTAHSSGKA